MARLRPSSAPKFRFCAGSVQMQEMFPETESKPSAEQGTACHEIGAKVLIEYIMGGSKILPFDYIGEITSNGVMFEEAMADAVDMYVDEILRACNEGGLLQVLQVEQHIKIPQVHDTESEGTPDCWVYNRQEHTLDLWDLKYGHGIIEAAWNWQLINYAIGIANKLATNGIKTSNMTINLHIVQPRAFHIDGPIRTWKIMGSDLVGYTKILVNQGALALAPNPPTKAGPHCKHCTALFVCQAANQTAMNAIDVAGEMVVEVIPPEQLKLHRDTLQRGKDAIDERLESINGQIEGCLSQRVTVAGLALDAPKQGKLEWTKSHEEILTLGTLFGVDLSKNSVKTPTQCKKLIDESVIKGYAVRKPGKTIIVNSNETKAARVFGKKRN